MSRFLIFFLCLSFSLSAAPLRIGVLQELGAFAEPLAALLEKGGVPAETVVVSSARLLAEMKAGTLQGGFLFNDVGIAANPGMRKVPVVLYQNEYIAVTANRNLKVRSVADLGGLRVGYVRGNPLYELIISESPNAIALDVTDATQLYKMIGADRVDAILSTQSALELFASLSEKPLYAQLPPLKVFPLYLVLSADVPEAMAKVTAVLDKAVKSGEWAKIVKLAFEQLKAQASKP